MVHEVAHEDGVQVSDELRRFDLDRAHEWIGSQTYWAKGIPRETFEAAVTNSLTIGAYLPDGAMVGMARVVTDRATFGWICDVFVAQDFRGLGLGKRLMAYVGGHPDLQGFRRLHLATRDAHELYRQFGFVPLTGVDRWMEIRGPGYL